MSVNWKYFLLILSLATLTVWLAVLTFPGGELHLIACDVGQGDAVLAVYADKQILIDGGPNSKVTECLDRYMPFWDRRVEVVILTHPQADHFRGLIEVFKKFEVETFITIPIGSGSQEYDLLKNMVGGSGVKVVDATSGSDVRLGLIYLDILHPSFSYLASESRPSEDSNDKDILSAYSTNKNLNDFSVVVLLSFGDFDALLTGDIGPYVSDMLSKEFALSAKQEVEYIKIPHHGSKNGISSNLLEQTNPEIAVISVGKNNPYGHPHEEVIKLLKNQGVEILRTDEMGDVEVVTNGKEFWLVK